MRAARLAAALLATAGLAACNKPLAGPAPVRPVLSTLVSTSAADQLTLIGTVQPRVQTAFSFRVLGRLIARPVNTGDLVAKGQTLAAIDSTALRLGMQAADAALASSQAQLANAIGIEDRQNQLLHSNATTQAQMDSAVQARAAAQALQTRSMSELAKSREQLGYSIIQSDFAGVVTSTGAEVGQTVSPGEAVVNVAEPSERDAVIDIPDAEAGDIALGAKFEASPELDATIRALGEVREIAPAADAATRTRRVKIALTKPPDVFRLGSTIVARLLSSSSKAVVRLPRSAILEKDGRDFVWVVDPKTLTVATLAVTVANAKADPVVVTSGLEPAMRVVTAGVHSLQDGQAVKLDSQAAP